jgi:hypothetical protein
MAYDDGFETTFSTVLKTALDTASTVLKTALDTASRRHRNGLETVRVDGGPRDDGLDGLSMALVTASRRPQNDRFDGSEDGPRAGI